MKTVVCRLLVVWVLGIPAWASGANWPGPDGVGYVGEASTYDLVDPHQGVSHGVLDENVIGPVPIGFAFPFYGDTHTEAYLSSNGFLAFAPISPTPLNQCPLPDANAPNGIIAAMWDDLVGGIIQVVTYSPGFCPYAGYQRACFVARWEDFYHAPFSAFSPAGTFEVILHENGDVVIQFEDTGDELGSGSTTGIEGADAASDHGLLYTCDTSSSLADGDAIRFRADIGVFVAPDQMDLTLCDGRLHPATLNLVNRTGSVGTFDLSYNVPSGNASLVGPPSVTVADGAVLPFTVELSTASCAAGGAVTATVTATGNGRSNIATLSATTGEMRVLSVPNSAPPWRGEGIPGDGCTALNDQGHWVTWIIGDGWTTGFSGLWRYDHTTADWINPTLAGPTDRYHPEWAYDPDSNLCYLTGGGNPSTNQPYAEVWVLDPFAVSFTQLADMTTARQAHSSWVATVNNTRVLCVAGGEGPAANLVSTQCFDLGAASWLAEDATLGALSLTIAAAADGVRRLPTGDQLWVAGGVQGNSSYSDEAFFFDDATDTWVSGGSSGVNVSHAEGGFLDGVFYQFGGRSDTVFVEAPVLRTFFDGSGWQWEQVTDRIPARFAPVVAELPGALAVVDGYRPGANTDVAVLEPCPGCLRGAVLDGELPVPTPPCTTAEVIIESIPVVAPVDPASGEWGPIELAPGDYEVTAWASGYEEDGPFPVVVFGGTTTDQDLSLQRPVIDYTPPLFEVWWPEGFATARTLALADAGHVDLSFDITELPPVDWLTVSPVGGVIPALSEQTIGLGLVCPEVGDHGAVLLVASNDPCDPEVELQVTLHCLPDGLFADSFETGNTEAWSGAVP